MPEIPDQAARDQFEKLLGAPILFPKEFKDWMADFVALNIPLIPFSHIFGAKINIARSGNFIATAEAGPSATAYGDCATVGPLLTGLADGSYLIVYGARGRDRTSISINGATAVDADSFYGTEAGPSSARMKISSLKNNDNNTITMKYKGTNTFALRWLIVIRLGAP